MEEGNCRVTIRAYEDQINTKTVIGYFTCPSDGLFGRPWPIKAAMKSVKF